VQDRVPRLGRLLELLEVELEDSLPGYWQTRMHRSEASPQAAQSQERFLD
jgi:hypothetical protein